MSSSSIFVILLAIGIGLIGWGVQLLRKAKESEHWPTASGEIKLSEVERRVDNDGKRSVKYYPNVVYDYTVSGRTYTSNCVSSINFGTTSPKGHALETTRKYRVGRKVKVYYNPDDNSSAVLQPGVTLVNYMPMLVGVVMMVAGAVIYISG